MGHRLSSYGAQLLLVALACVFVIVPQAALAQETLTARLLPHGAVSISSGDRPLATLSLNAHGPDWKHVDQDAATAEASGDRELMRFLGTLPVPNTDDGAIRFAETIEPRANGLVADYVLGPTQAMQLNGLHISLLMPAEALVGRTIRVHPPAAKGPTAQADAPEKVQGIALPAHLDEKGWQLFTGPASKVEIAPGTDDAITVAPLAFEPTMEGMAEPPIFAVQDLRKWDQDTIEVRLSLVMADKGTWLSAWDKMHAAASISFVRELRWP